MRDIPLSVPNLDAEIIENLKECVETGWISTGGRFISEFESAMAKYTDVPDAVGCQSGTAGLHVALRLLGVEAGDEVIVPTLTFIAAVNPIIYQGASPVFMDCDRFFCIDPDKLERFCREDCETTQEGLKNKSTGSYVKAVVVVHIFGNLADMDKIMPIAKKYKLKVLEDATEALGSFWTEGRYKARHAGTVGDMGVFSFNANKIITTGGGGMIVSNSARLLEKARYLTVTAKDDGLYFVHNEVGYNYRMLNIQAAFGVSQVKRLDEFVAIKMRNFNRYRQSIRELGIKGFELLPYSDGVRSNHWFYSFYVDESVFGMSRDGLMIELIDLGIQCRPIWKLCHLQRPYRKAQTYRIEQALDYGKCILNLPCSTNLTEDDVVYICRMVNDLRIGVANG